MGKRPTSVMKKPEAPLLRLSGKPVQQLPSEEEERLFKFSPLSSKKFEGESGNTSMQSKPAHSPLFQNPHTNSCSSSTVERSLLGPAEVAPQRPTSALIVESRSSHPTH